MRIKIILKVNPTWQPCLLVQEPEDGETPFPQGKIYIYICIMLGFYDTNVGTSNYEIWSKHIKQTPFSSISSDVLSLFAPML